MSGNYFNIFTVNLSINLYFTLLHMEDRTHVNNLTYIIIIHIYLLVDNVKGTKLYLYRTLGEILFKRTEL